LLSGSLNAPVLQLAAWLLFLQQSLVQIEANFGRLHCRDTSGSSGSSIGFPTIGLLLQIRLVQTIRLQRDWQDTTVGAFGLWQSTIEPLFSQPWDRLLKPVNHRTEIVYSTAIAHKLAAYLQCPVAEIVSLVATAVQSNPSFSNLDLLTIPHLCDIWDAMVVYITEPGLIRFKIADRAISVWLDLLVHQSPSFAKVFPAPTLPAETVFALQHAHARCCSWLQLLHREALISLNNLDRPPLEWQLTTPIPWLTPAQTLLPDHPAERHLMRQLVWAMDAIAHTPDPCKTALDQALEVSLAFQAMHRDCPMLQDRTVAGLMAARSGLLLATQRVLRLLLEDGLALAAPAEL
jgi:hypothetical protein